jgi:hypothetical protein
MALFLAGCAPAAVNVSHDAPASAHIAPAGGDGAPAALSRLGVLEPEMLLYDVSAGGIFEYRDDWSKSASRRLAVSSAVKLSVMGYGAAVLPDVGRSLDFFRLKTRMRYHCSAFQSAFFANAGMSPEDDGLTFSLAPQDELCDLYGVDGFLYIYGFQEKFSAERLSMKGIAPIERTFMAAILVERSGRVSWYRHLMVSGSLDMRDGNHAMRMVGAMFE